VVSSRYHPLVFGTAGTYPGHLSRGSGLLVQPEHVSIRIGEACRQFGSIHADRLNDVSAVGVDGLNGRVRLSTMT
jgi:hypothetical protein